jgi:hypothetical protein
MKGVGMMEERKKRITEVFKEVFNLEPSEISIQRDTFGEQLKAYRCFQLFNVQFELSVVELSEFEKSLLKNSFKNPFMKEDTSYRKYNIRMFVIQFYVKENYRVEIWIGIFPLNK